MRLHATNITFDEVLLYGFGGAVNLCILRRSMQIVHRLRRFTPARES